MNALVYPTSDSPRITIRHLMSHAEGFPEDNPWGDQQLAESDERMSAHDRAASRSRTRPASPTSTPTSASPSSAGSSPTSRSRAIDDGAYTRTSTENVLKPLGMTSTTLEPSRVPPIGSRTAIAGKTASGRTSRCSPTDRSARWAAC
jgi:CubicO group peptidase (beta-lactamase class C family)